jgi:hypothetical protein
MIISGVLGLAVRDFKKEEINQDQNVHKYKPNFKLKTFSILKNSLPRHFLKRLLAVRYFNSLLFIIFFHKNQSHIHKSKK